MNKNVNLTVLGVLALLQAIVQLLAITSVFVDIAIVAFVVMMRVAIEAIMLIVRPVRM